MYVPSGSVATCLAGSFLGRRRDAIARSVCQIPWVASANLYAHWREIGGDAEARSGTDDAVIVLLFQS